MAIAVAPGPDRDKSDRRATIALVVILVIFFALFAYSLLDAYFL